MGEAREEGQAAAAPRILPVATLAAMDCSCTVGERTFTLCSAPESQSLISLSRLARRSASSSFSKSCPALRSPITGQLAGLTYKASSVLVPLLLVPQARCQLLGAVKEGQLLLPAR